MDIKKIMFLHEGASWNRGSEKVLLEILGNLDKNRFEAVLVCNHQKLAAEAERLGVKTYKLDWAEVMIDKGYVRLQFIRLLRTILRLRGIIKSEFTDMVVCNGGLANQAGLFAARMTDTPIAVYIHSPYMKRYIYLYGLNRTNMAIFVSNAIRNSMIGKAGFRSELVIHNGIDIDKFHPVIAGSIEAPDGLSIDRDKVIIGQVGSLINLKGVDLLIEAGKKLADRGLIFHIVLVGSGPGEARFQQMVEHLNLSSHITFFGYSDAPEKIYQGIFDINVLASRSEAFGLTLAEGAACGLPCVGANTGGIPEVIRENETGLLFEPGNANDLANKLEMLITNPVLRKEFGSKGRKYIVEHLSMSKQVEEFSDVISRLA